jgi:hypothetical protein
VVVKIRRFYMRLLVRGRRLLRKVEKVFYSRLSKRDKENAVQAVGRFANWRQSASGLMISKRKPVNLYPYIHARSGVKSQFRITAFVYLVALILIPVIYVRWIFTPHRPGEKAQSIMTVEGNYSPLGLPPVGVTATSPAPGFLVTPTASPLVTSTVLPSTPTAYPTYTPYPSYTPVSGEVFYYSYYDPGLGPPNCWDWDAVEGVCRSLMSSGLDWRNYFGKSLACGEEYPLYTVFRVIHPVELAGDYPCLDRCPACSGLRVLDFLDTKQRLPWQYQLLVQVIRQ